jgi:hypothetical protein
LINDYKIDYESLNGDFPNEFFFSFKSFDINFKLKLLKKSLNQHDSKVYTISNGKIVEYEFGSEKVCWSKVRY